MLEKRGVVMYILFITFPFSCDSFDCDVYKNSQFAIKGIKTRPTVQYSWTILYLCENVMLLQMKVLRK